MRLVTLHSTLGALALALVTVACEEPPPRSDVVVDIGPERPIDLGTGPDRGRRRMDIEQLDAAMRRATGGLGWDDSSGRSMFTAQAATLGVPDYVQSTSEDLEISALFIKFLDDASRSVCDRLMTREAAAAPGERVFLVHADLDARLPADAAAIDQNLSMLLLRFHGRRVAVDSPELAPWHDLMDQALAASPDDAAPAWRTTCVALFEHPDFYTY